MLKKNVSTYLILFFLNESQVRIDAPERKENDSKWKGYLVVENLPNQ